jgi:hypothetical protein
MLKLQSINVMETILEGLGLHKCHIQLRVVVRKVRPCLDPKIFGKKIPIALLLLFGQIYPTMD